MGVALVAGPVTAFQQEREPKQKQEGHDEGMQAMMEAWMKAAQPGEHHALLQPLVGSWNMAVKWRMASDAPWQESVSSAEYRWIMGGRYLVEKGKGDMEEGPFEGMGILGYDNLRKKFTSIWIDSMSTATMVAYGTSDASGKTITFVGEGINPMTGQPQKEKSRIRIINNNKFLFEMYQPGPDGKEFLSMEVTCTRK
jgi:hypothetical protein